MKDSTVLLEEPSASDLRPKDVSAGGEIRVQFKNFCGLTGPWAALGLAQGSVHTMATQ